MYFYIGLFVLCLFIILISIFHKEIIDALDFDHISAKKLIIIIIITLVVIILLWPLILAGAIGYFLRKYLNNKEKFKKFINLVND